VPAPEHLVQLPLDHCVDPCERTARRDEEPLYPLTERLAFRILGRRRQRTTVAADPVISPEELAGFHQFVRREKPYFAVAQVRHLAEKALPPSEPARAAIPA
jgi:hypothetical protein